jgi:hypothetical protein
MSGRQGIWNGVPKRPRRERAARRPTSWVRVSSRAHQHPDVAELPSDTARWAWVCTLLEAKQLPEPGSFRSEDHLRRAIGWRLARSLPSLYEAGLLEPDSDGSGLGRVEVHNWSRWQTDRRSDATHADRQKRYREREKAKRDASRDGVTLEGGVTTSDGGPPTSREATVTPPLRAAVTVSRQDVLSERRTLAQAIRDAKDPSLKGRYQNTFQKLYGHLYERGVAA